MDEKNGKVERTLGIYTRLMNGYIVNKAEEANRYGVNERSIQRDIDDIRNYLELDAESHGFINSVIYDRGRQGYRLEQIYKMRLTNSEVLAICKILLDSRALTKNEMTDVLQKLIDCCVPQSNQKLVEQLIKNEEFHYIEPRHHTVFLDTLWDIGTAIQESRYIEIKYQGVLGTTVKTRKLKPLAIIFSEYYFYLTAFIEDEKVRENFDVINDAFPTIYRVDRIKQLKITNERYRIPYKDRFEEGEFRKRIQFMYGGKLQRIKFEYSGPDIDAILDRLPTAKIIDKLDGNYIVCAEVFGKGIDMWLRSQGEKVKLL